jgi:pre-mRNA-splicing factor SYF1
MEMDAEVLSYEEEVMRDPYNISSWQQYMQYKSGAPARERNILFERALKRLPGSYKLWLAYLRERREQVRPVPAPPPPALLCPALRVVWCSRSPPPPLSPPAGCRSPATQVRGRCPTDGAVTALNETYERCLVFLHKMPRIWMEYAEFLTGQAHLITSTRRMFDRALQALPILQHEHIWPLYIKFIRGCGVVDTALRVYRRYLKLQPDKLEEFVGYLLSAGRFDEACSQLCHAVNSEDFISREGKSKHEIWLQLCGLLSKHPESVAGAGLRAEAIIRAGIRKFTDETGKLWTSLADYHTRLGAFERARDVYEEAMCTVKTVRDFAIVFDAYTKLEESIIAATMEDAEDEDEEDDDDELELRLAFLEHLMDRRPVLLSSVLLRQNPHNVHEWHKRVKLFDKNPQKVVLTYTEAVKTVASAQATGKPHSLWCAFARFYERHSDIPNARVIFEKATQVEFKSVDDLATVWCEYAEMELRNRNVDRARELLERATVESPASRRQKDGAVLTVQQRLHRSTKLWSFYADLEESLGTVKKTSAVYDRMLDLKVATPQTVLCYARYLEEHKYFEESFKAYERGIHAFGFPHVHSIWVDYLSKFVNRYGGRKLERARDLFEQVVGDVPADSAMLFFMMYARLEEEYGLVRHAMSVYDRATKAVDDKNRHQVFQIYIKKAAEFFGVTRTREIFERAIESLGSEHVRETCVQYADLERRLGEVDRARAVLSHASQFCDPRVDAKFWAQFNDFEVHHGNEDTFREMLLLKRSVQAQYTEVSLASGQYQLPGVLA